MYEVFYSSIVVSFFDKSSFVSSVICVWGSDCHDNSATKHVCFLWNVLNWNGCKCFFPVDLLFEFKLSWHLSELYMGSNLKKASASSVGYT